MFPVRGSCAISSVVEHFIDIEGVAGSIPASRTKRIRTRRKNFLRHRTMTFEEYQKESRRTAQYPDAGSNFVYPTLGLSGEAGEVAEKIKKVIRDKNGVVDAQMRDAIAKELGDVLWYAAQLATELNIPFEDIARGNLEKLFSRLDRGKLHGDGDER